MLGFHHNVTKLSIQVQERTVTRMIKNWLKKKMEIINEKKKNNEGFTLVELIVVIVILAILIGVTIGGIYMYVGQSKVNTDKNNASSIVSVCGTANADETVYSKLEANKTVTYTWTDAVKNADIAASADDSTNKALGGAITTYLKTVLPDGLPKAQTGKAFTLTFKVNADATSLSVTCTQAE